MIAERSPRVEEAASQRASSIFRQASTPTADGRWQVALQGGGGEGHVFVGVGGDELVEDAALRVGPGGHGEGEDQEQGARGRARRAQALPQGAAGSLGSLGSAHPVPELKHESARSSRGAPLSLAARGP